MNVDSGIVAGKVALVTGGGRGIGRAIALTLAREGAGVAILEREADAGEETAALVRAQGRDSLAVGADVAVEAEVEAAIAAVVKHFGRIDIACNNAAASRGQGFIHEFSHEDFAQTVAGCLTNTWLCMKYELQAMLTASRGGAIVNISSRAAQYGHPCNTPYAAAKGGVNVLTQSTAAEYAKDGIRINAVAPGVIRTPGVAQYLEAYPQRAEELNAAAALGRLGEPGEIAEAVVFLASGRASFITGQILYVDGGASVNRP
ncbi:MAG: 2,5-dichloro-2,5-cyclohexadiene-1,4-diol dehydrogenase [Steroidobacteraceae bacterium]|nr:2,5-dichloro-2,5-cyclohexadiene-1,4-diol dehydrogenase [Steroidobacteraceae bacterium]